MTKIFNPLMLFASIIVFLTLFVPVAAQDTTTSCPKLLATVVAIDLTDFHWSPNKPIAAAYFSKIIS